MHALESSNICLTKNNENPEVELFRLKQRKKKKADLYVAKSSSNVSFWNIGLLKMKRMTYVWGESDQKTFSMSPMGLLWRRKKKRILGLDFKLWTAAYNPHILIYFSILLLHSKHIQLQIYLKYGDIYIYRCTFYKNVCMPSGAGFVKTVTMAALSVEIQGFVKRGREHILNFCFFIISFWTKKKEKIETNCMPECRLPNVCLRFDCY